jgi:hypothetical protein
MQTGIGCLNYQFFLLISVGISGVTKQSAAFDPHADVGRVIKTKGQLSATEERHYNPRPGGIYLSVSFVNADWNWLFKISVFSTVSVTRIPSRFRGAKPELSEGERTNPIYPHKACGPDIYYFK